MAATNVAIRPHDRSRHSPTLQTANTRPQTKLVTDNSAIGMDVDRGTSANALAWRKAHPARARLKLLPNNNTSRLKKVTRLGRLGLGFEFIREFPPVEMI